MKVIIGLGSNIDPERNIPLAVRLLGRCDGWSVLAVSPTYESAAVGMDGPDFHNAAVLVETSLDRDDLQSRLRAIEDRMGRVRTDDKFAPRPIDLDVVAFEDGSWVDPDLGRFPHVAVPAADLAQNWEYDAAGRTFGEVAASLDREGLARMTAELVPIDHTRH